MSSYDSNRIALTNVAEVTAGTRVEPQASDNNIVYIGTGQPTIVFNNNPLGKLFDGSFDDAPVAGGQKTIAMPDYMMEVKAAATTAEEPKWWKDGKACGGKVVDNAGALGLLFDGSPDCSTNSSNLINLDCSGNAAKWKGRGMRGNIVIGWSGANAPIMATVSGLTGAYISKEEIASATPVVITGEDDTFRETAAKYVITLGSNVYQVHVCEIDNGNAVTMEAGNNPSGVVTGKITGKEKRLKMTMTMLTTGDTVAEDAENNIVYDEVTIIGTGDAGYDITISDCHLLDPSIGDVDGSTSWEVETTFKSVLFQQK